MLPLACLENRSSREANGIHKKIREKKGKLDPLNLYQNEGFFFLILKERLFSLSVGECGYRPEMCMSVRLHFLVTSGTSGVLPSP